MTNEFNPEDIDSVFTQFGWTIYSAQCLEKQLALLLINGCNPISQKMTTLRYDELLENNLDHTFGTLATNIKEIIPLPIDISEKLDLAVEKRNWIAHTYWWDRASEINNTNGRQKMLIELNELNSLFTELDNYFTNIFKIWAFQNGLTQNDFDEELKNILSSPTPARIKRRKLNKKENLINIYTYQIGDGATLLFELEDHSLWSLCDCGLTYGPDNIELTKLTSLDRVKNALPAIITPKPKNAKEWKYTFALDNGYKIEILPSSKLIQFQWKLTLP